MESNAKSPMVRKGRRGKVLMPKVICGPGQNCKNSSAAACRAIAAILENGNKTVASEKLKQALSQSCHEDYLQP